MSGQAVAEERPRRQFPLEGAPWASQGNQLQPQKRILKGKSSSPSQLRRGRLGARRRPRPIGETRPGWGKRTAGRPGQVWRGKPRCVKPDHAEQSTVSQAPLLALAAARHYNPVKMSSCPQGPAGLPSHPFTRTRAPGTGIRGCGTQAFSRTHPRTLCMDAECISIWCLLPHPSLREH